jgi:hypothetical protein
MKLVAFAIVLLPAAASADLLTSLSPFLSDPAPDYTREHREAIGAPSLTPYSPGDSDLGFQQILGAYSGLPPVNFSFDLTGNYTDNAPGTFPGGDVNSFFLSTRLAAGWQPRLARGWFADLGAGADIVRFENSNAENFENLQGHLGVAKAFADLGDMVFFSRYEYQRITGSSWANDDYTAGRIRTGVQKPLFLTARQQLSGSLDATFDLHATPGLLERNSFSAELSYAWWLSDRLTGSLAWSASFWDFRNEDREDWHHLVGLGLAYRLSESVTVTGSLFYTNHNSDAGWGGVNDFEAWQTGMGFGCKLTF